MSNDPRWTLREADTMGDPSRLPYEVRDNEGERRADFLYREDAERFLRAITIEGSVPARKLEPGWQVKAPGAPAWSRIRAIGNVTPGKVEAFTEWGSLIYEAHELVEALEPVN